MSPTPSSGRSHWVPATVSPLQRSSGPGPRPAVPTVATAIGGQSHAHLAASIEAQGAGQGHSGVAWKVLAGASALVAIALGLSLLTRSPEPPPTPPVFTQTGALTYHASTRASATYPTGQIVTGDPVFLKLVDRLGVSFFYSTDAPRSSVHGTAQLDAVIAASSGWKTSIPLVKATPVTANGADLTAHLDMARILAIANSVATATSVYMGSLTLTLTAVANVRFDGARPVTCRVQLPLSLSALELSVETGDPTPTAHGPAVVSSSSLNPVTTSPQHSSKSHTIRLWLLAALGLLIAATIVAIPSEEEKDRELARS